jgi:hypothetical protein
MIFAMPNSRTTSYGACQRQKLESSGDRQEHEIGQKSTCEDKTAFIHVTLRKSNKTEDLDLN